MIRSWRPTEQEAWSAPSPEMDSLGSTRSLHAPSRPAQELMCSEISKKAQLTTAEVVAGRLYTGPMFKLYNDILRNPQGLDHRSFIYTIHAFASCIVKLSRVHQTTTLYRGIKGGALPNTFLNADEYGTRGGVEFGFMLLCTMVYLLNSFNSWFSMFSKINFALKS